jgi:hypothetical protein
MGLTHRPGRAQHGPRAFQAPRVDAGWWGLSPSSGQRDYARCED